MSGSEPTSVFTDDSGDRVRKLVWLGRGVLVLLGLGLAAVAFSLVTQVTLPGLDGPVHLPGADAGGASRDKPAKESDPTTGPTSGPGMASPTSGSTSDSDASQVSGTEPNRGPTRAPTGVVPVTTPTAGPTHAPTTKSTKNNVKSSDAPRAHPTHTGGGGPPPTPPGKNK